MCGASQKRYELTPGRPCRETGAKEMRFARMPLLRMLYEAATPLFGERYLRGLRLGSSPRHLQGQ